MSGYLLSVCIPTWNGSETLDETLTSILSQHDPRVEIILCDDGSNDRTWEMVQGYASKFPFIRAFRNEQNLGMDGNFRKTALHASSSMVWFSGQDDVFEPGVVGKVLSVLEKRPDLGLIYLNYSQNSHDMSRVLVTSVLHEECLKPEVLDQGQDCYFQSAEDYFSVFTAAPSFLPATVMRRDFWEGTDVSAYSGTAFVQMALILLNLNRYPICVVGKPMIKGRIPADRWQANGNAYFAVMLGSLKAEALVFRDRRNSMPAAIFEKRKKIFLRNYFALVRVSKEKGYRLVPEDLQSLKVIFGDGPLFRFWLEPLLRFPLGALIGMHRAYRVVQRSNCFFKSSS